MKRRVILASIFSLCTSCLGETSAQEPIPLFDIEDKEPQAPVDPPDPGPPTHPTAPPPKPQPLVFAPGQLPWAPVGYTVYFHLKEEAEWTENYLGKIPGQRIATTHASRISFTPLAFLPQRYQYSDRRSFQAIEMPPKFFGGLKELHFFERSNKGHYFVNNIYIKRGASYQFKSNKDIEDFFIKNPCNQRDDLKICPDISGYHVVTTKLEELNNSDAFKVKTKYIYSFGDNNKIFTSEDLESKNPEKTWKESCRDMGWSIYDQKERFGDNLSNQNIKICAPISIEVPFDYNDQTYLSRDIHQITQINP